VFQSVVNPSVIASIRIKFTDMRSSLTTAVSPTITAATTGAAAMLQIPGRNVYVRRLFKLPASEVTADQVVGLAEQSASVRHNRQEASQAAVADAQTRATAAQTAATSAEAKLIEQTAILTQQQRDLAQAAHEVDAARASSVANAHTLEFGQAQYHDACQQRDAARAEVQQLQIQLNHLLVERQQSPDPAFPADFAPTHAAPTALAAPALAAPAAAALPPHHVMFDISDPSTWEGVLVLEKETDLVTRLQIEFGVTTSSSPRLQDAFQLLCQQISALCSGSARKDANSLRLLQLARNNVRDCFAMDKYGDAAVASARADWTKQQNRRNPFSEAAYLALCESHSHSQGQRNSTVRCSRCGLLGHYARTCHVQLPSQGGAQGDKRRAH
jgi:hypothetical protein